MTTTPEGKVKVGIKAYLKAKGVWYCMPMGTGFGSSGVPDFLICYRGHFVAIEAKAPGRIANTTAGQKDQIAKILSNGGRAVVVDSASQLDAVFATL
jgi:hypothetical protein